MNNRKERVCVVCGKTIIYQHKHKPELCPFCKDPLWDKPKDERDLFLLQDIYIKNGCNKDDLGPMYLKLLSYAKNIIKHKLRNKVILSLEDFNEKASDIAIIMIERYLKNPKERINHSFGGMMMWIANGVLYGQKKDSNTLSLNETLFDNSNELIESLQFFSHSEVHELYKYDPQNKILNQSTLNIKKGLHRIIDYIYSIFSKEKKSTEHFFYLIGLRHFLDNKKDFFMREFYNLVSSKTVHRIEKTKLSLRNYLKGKEFNE